VTWLVGLILACIILYLIPFRIVRLYRKDQLTARSFALTFAVGWSLVILILYYSALADTLLTQKDPLLTSLGILIAAINFALGYPITMMIHKYVLTNWLERISKK
jgi:uncharacterized membrane protein